MFQVYLALDYHNSQQHKIWKAQIIAEPTLISLEKQKNIYRTIEETHALKLKQQNQKLKK